MQVGEVAIERPRVAALDVDLAGAAAKDDGAKPVPLGLVEPALALGKLVGELREHGLDRRRDRGDGGDFESLNCRNDPRHRRGAAAALRARRFRSHRACVRARARARMPRRSFRATSAAIPRIPRPGRGPWCGSATIRRSRFVGRRTRRPSTPRSTLWSVAIVGSPALVSAASRSASPATTIPATPAGTPTPASTAATRRCGSTCDRADAPCSCCSSSPTSEENDAPTRIKVGSHLEVPPPARARWRSRPHLSRARRALRPRLGPSDRVGDRRRGRRLSLPPVPGARGAAASRGDTQVHGAAAASARAPDRARSRRR